MDNITLFSIITIMSLFLLAPVAIFIEGVKFTPAYMQSAVSTMDDLKLLQLSWFHFSWKKCCLNFLVINYTFILSNRV